MQTSQEHPRQAAGLFWQVSPHLVGCIKKCSEHLALQGCRSLGLFRPSIPWQRALALSKAKTNSLASPASTLSSRRRPLCTISVTSSSTCPPVERRATLPRGRLLVDSQLLLEGGGVRLASRQPVMTFKKSTSERRSLMVSAKNDVRMDVPWWPSGRMLTWKR